jgi:hypothetical protein
VGIGQKGFECHREILFQSVFFWEGWWRKGGQAFANAAERQNSGWL